LIIKGIRLINYRNYNSMSASFGSGINILVGKNAQGKTNLLEAIYMCSTGRSFRTLRDKELISFGKNEAYVAAELNIGELEKFTEIKLEADKSKRIRVNKVELKSYKELNTGLKVVVFFPDDLKLVKEGPGNRRNYLDSSISQLKPVYHHNLSRYYKALIQKNNLLKSRRSTSELQELLEVFDVQLARLGTLISMEREQYIRRIKKEARDIHLQITSGKEELDIKYNTNVPEGESLLDIERKYLEQLRRGRARDIEIGSTSIGPHRDDFIPSINGNDLRTFGSQGQQRTLVLTLKLSEVKILKKETGYYPVLLLDDVYSELDEERREFLTSLFSETQTFITVTDAIEADSLKNFDKTIYYVREGCLYNGNKTWREVNGE
jgi:DNA replication and repair protein RecF